VWYVVLWGEERTKAYRVSMGNVKEKGRLQDLVVDVRVILKCILERGEDRRVWTGLFLLRADTSGVLL
jgi:hypothetical protein